MIRGPSPYVTADSDSGRTIRLTGNFLWWNGGTPSDAKGRYTIHADSIRRKPRVFSWDNDGRTMEMTSWSLWCWRRYDTDAIRIFLQVIQQPGDPFLGELSRVFPQHIGFRSSRRSWNPDTVAVTFTPSGGDRQRMSISLPLSIPYCWAQSYCRVCPAVEEYTDGVRAEYGERPVSPDEPFTEEAEFEERLGTLLLRQECEKITGLMAEVKSEAEVLTRERDDLLRKEGEEATRRMCEALRTLPSALYARVYLLTVKDGLLQRQIANKLGKSLGWVNGALAWFRERGFPVGSQRRSTRSMAADVSDGHRVNGRSLGLPFSGDPQEIGDPESYGASSEENGDSWPGEGHG